MKIKFTLHANQKLTRLAKIGITKEKVVKTVNNPKKVVNGYFGRKIAQSYLTNDLILRVVYEQTEKEILIITIYPGKRRRYEWKSDMMEKEIH